MFLKIAQIGRVAIYAQWKAPDRLEKFACYDNRVPKKNISIGGEALARDAKEYVDAAYERVRKTLEWDLLPNAILAIWGHLPQLEEARKKEPAPMPQIREMCHVLVTFPGSTAVRRISEILINGEYESSIEKAEATGLDIFNLTMRYVKVQNLARHIRTAVNSHLRVLGIETNTRERNSSEYEQNLESLSMTDNMRDKAYKLKSANLKSESDVNEWADEVNLLLATYSRNALEGNFNTDSSRRFTTGMRSTRGAVAEGGIKSYRLRFKQALAATLGIDLNQKDVEIEKTASKSIDDHLNAFANDPKDHAELYSRLQTLRPREVGRPNTRRVQWTFQEQKLGAESPKKSLLKHVLNLDGRELIIEGSRGAFTDDMISGVLKTVSLQYSIEPEAKNLKAAFESRGQVLRIEIERPKKSDHKKIGEILRQLG